VSDDAIGRGAAGRHDPRGDLVLRGGTLADGTRVDIAIRNGRISRIAPRVDEPGVETEEVGGHVVLPSFVDLHMHLDKAFTLELTANKSGTLEEAIARYDALLPRLTHAGFVERALRALRLCVAAGTTAARTHVNIAGNRHGTEGGAAGAAGLTPLEALLEVRERVRHALDLQIVLLPSGNPAHDRALYEACEEGLRMGADAVGGAPSLDPDPAGAIAAAFELARHFDRDVDLHVDESDDPDVRTLSLVADATRAADYAGRVTAGHCCSLAAMDDASAARLIGRVVAAGIAVVTLPSCNLYLQGRRDRQPIRRGLTRVKDLVAAGGGVAAASDNIRDPFNPFGRGDLLHIADLLAHAAQLGSPHEQGIARDAIGANPRAVFERVDPAPLRGGLPRVGDVADLVVCAAPSVDDLIALQPTRTLVLRHGRVVARTRAVVDAIF